MGSLSKLCHRRLDMRLFHSTIKASASTSVSDIVTRHHQLNGKTAVLAAFWSEFQMGRPKQHIGGCKIFSISSTDCSLTAVTV